MGNDVKGILLLAFGGPESLDDIEPFLKNVLKGRGMPPGLVERTKERYRLIGGRSPLLEITFAQARAIEEALRAAGENFRSYVGMLNWPPYIKDTLQKMKDDGVRESLAIIMTPFTSPVATGAYEKIVEDVRRDLGGTPRVKLISNWHISRPFALAVVEKIEEALRAFERKEDALVIFSSHSLPKEALEGDAYEMKIQQAVEAILREARLDYKVAFQSQGLSALEWLGPRVEDVIKEAKRAGKKGVVVVPLGFVADHVETLYDIDILFKAEAESQGLVFKRAASLNTSPAFISLLADLVLKQGEIY